MVQGPKASPLFMTFSAVSVSSGLKNPARLSLLVHALFQQVPEGSEALLGFSVARHDIRAGGGLAAVAGGVQRQADAAFFRIDAEDRRVDTFTPFEPTRTQSAKALISENDFRETLSQGGVNPYLPPIAAGIPKREARFANGAIAVRNVRNR